MTTIKIDKYIQASPSEVFLYFTNSTALREWLCDVATTNPQVGGRIYLYWNAGYYTSGEYLKVEPDKNITFIWFGRGEPHTTSVEVKLRKRKKGTQLTLIHRKLGNTSKWIEIGNEYQKQWAKYLDNLTSVLENGADLRITNRPMLGILTDEFNASVAEKLGIPVTEGLRISGLVEGLGAQQAGFIDNDVIVKLDGQAITGASTFGAFIGSKIAGDMIDVTFYRGAERKSTRVTLSGRPIPPIPASGIELSRQVEPVYKQYESELEAILNGATEEECSKKPAFTEWSVNEILAHLIHSERGWLNYVSEIIGGHEAAYDDFGGNVQAHIEGTVATYPSKDALFTQLKNHHTETLNLFSHISSDFLKQKGKYWKLAFQANQNPYHLQTHLAQIQSAIHSGRST